ncbi:MAG: hypothetical protein HYY84_08605 [Deltaproteobacteria bacterium]|nr:hypothetical protein [Deltaproteobacteria bacterium]
MKKALFSALVLGGVSTFAWSGVASAQKDPGTANVSSSILQIDGYSVVAIGPSKTAGKSLANVGVTVSIRNTSKDKTAKRVWPFRTKVRPAGALGTRWTWTAERFLDLTDGKKTTLAPGEVLKNTYRAVLKGSGLPACGKKVEIETHFGSTLGAGKVTHTSAVICPR